MIKSLELVLKTEQEIAQYFVNRDMQEVPLSLFQQELDDFGLNILYPSREVLIREYLLDFGFSTFTSTTYRLMMEYRPFSFTDDLGVNDGSEKAKRRYNELVGKFEEYLKDEEFLDFIEEKDFYQSWLEEFYGYWKPTWWQVYLVPEFYINSEYMNVDKLYSLGLGVFEKDSNYYLFTRGAGYDFMEKRFIPLFRELGWIKEEDRTRVGIVVDKMKELLKEYGLCIEFESVSDNKVCWNKLSFYDKVDTKRVNSLATFDLGNVVLNNDVITYKKDVL